jgi:hypothetical protein
MSGYYQELLKRERGNGFSYYLFSNRVEVHEDGHGHTETVWTSNPEATTKRLMERRK